MPAANPRMQVTPTLTSYLLLKELSKLTGQAPATITRELLQEAVPALQLAVDSLRDIKKRPERVQAAMARFSAQAINDLTQEQLDLDTALQKRRGPKPKSKGRGAAKTG